MAETLVGFGSARGGVADDLLGAAAEFYLDVLRRFHNSKSAVAGFGEVVETRAFLAAMYDNEVAMDDEGKKAYLFHLFHGELKDFDDACAN